MDNGMTPGEASLELYRPPRPQEGPPVRLAAESIDVFRLGETLAKCGFFSDVRDAGQAVVKILAGGELGFGPIASMTGVNIIKGRVTLSANLVASAIKRSGRYNYRVVRLDDTACEIKFYESGREIGLSSFTARDAQRAGTQNMGKFPRNMLFARAMTNGARWYCPDVFGGPVYTPDELGVAVDEETGEVLSIAADDVSPPDTGGISADAPPEVIDQEGGHWPVTAAVSGGALQARFRALGFERDLRLDFAGRLISRPPLISFSDLDDEERASLMVRVNYVERMLGSPEVVLNFAAFCRDFNLRADTKKRAARALADYVATRDGSEAA